MRDSYPPSLIVAVADAGGLNRKREE
jgi:hypothetical protein